MANGDPRSWLASAVGWLLAALIVYVFFGWIIGTMAWILRWAFVLFVVGGLFWLYFRLKGDPGS